MCSSFVPAPLKVLTMNCVCGYLFSAELVNDGFLRVLTTGYRFFIAACNIRLYNMKRIKKEACNTQMEQGITTIGNSGKLNNWSHIYVRSNSVNNITT